MEPLTERDIREALRDLPGWRLDEGALCWSFDFGSFRAAVAFIVAMGFEAEALDHHPELHNIYGKVDLRLTTHDAGGQVTRRDIALAQAVAGLMSQSRG